MKKLLFITALWLSAGSAMAQDANTAGTDAQTPPPPPCADELFRQFDFWVGEWDVFSTDGSVAGKNIISIEENGCLLVERWTGVQGSTGQSYNFVDLGSKKWRQVWVSPGATIDYEGGLNNNGAMELKGKIAYSNGNTARFKGTWTLQDDGSVRQHFQQYNKDQKKWADWFIGIYKKAAE
ncbi:MAG: hypothetical protein DHS20C05_11240 [Hyphococcus sp.]|nr:MAG: hypothetical protein DHS20C05_11240 [Marinicaulis sp.]